MSGIYFDLEEKLLEEKLINYFIEIYPYTQKLIDATSLTSQDILITTYSRLIAFKDMPIKHIIVLYNPKTERIATEDSKKITALPYPINLNSLQKVVENNLLTLSKIISLADYEIDLNKSVLYDKNHSIEISLSEKEALIMKFLFEYYPEPISKENFLDKVWNANPNIQTQSLETYISLIRKKLRENRINLTIVKIDLGYKLQIF